MGADFPRLDGGEGVKFFLTRLDILIARQRFQFLLGRVSIDRLDAMFGLFGGIGKLPSYAYLASSLNSST